MRGKQKAENVTDVTEAQERTVKGKLPRNVVLALGGVAALMVGALGYYFQTVSDEQIDAKAQQARADEIKQRAGSADNGQSLDAAIRAQAEKAREEADKQRRPAIATDTKAPFMTGSDLGRSGKGLSTAAPDAKKNAQDDLFTASVFKSGTRKSQVNQVKQPAGLADVTDPNQMRAIQQAVAAKAAAVRPPARSSVSIPNSAARSRCARAASAPTSPTTR